MGSGLGFGFGLGSGWGLGVGVGLEGWRWASALVERKAWQSSGRMTLVLPEPT